MSTQHDIGALDDALCDIRHELGRLAKALPALDQSARAQLATTSARVDYAAELSQALVGQEKTM